MRFGAVPAAIERQRQGADYGGIARHQVVGAGQGLDGAIQVTFAALRLAEAEVEIAGGRRIGIQVFERLLKSGDRGVELAGLHGRAAFGQQLPQGLSRIRLSPAQR